MCDKISQLFNSHCDFFLDFSIHSILPCLGGHWRQGNSVTVESRLYRLDVWDSFPSRGNDGIFFSLSLCPYWLWSPASYPMGTMGFMLGVK